NNGGDGFVMAGLAMAAGLELELWHLPPRTTSTTSAAVALAQAREAGIVIRAIDPDSLAFEMATFAPDLIIDALFGIGLVRAPDATAAVTIRMIDDFSAPCLALDVPSGLDADRGSAPGEAVRATVTISFIGAKFGCATGGGRALCGERVEHDLGVSPRCLEGLNVAASRFDPDDLRTRLPPRPLNASKQDAGHALLIGGDRGMGGALCLAAEAALRVGVGRLSAWTRAEHVPVLLSRRPEAMTRRVDAFNADTVPSTVNVLALGPGLGRGDWGRAALDLALADSRPLLLDADALNLLAERGQAAWSDGRVVILTPHSGEAARLLGIAREAVEADRLAAVTALAERYCATVVLKGAGSLVATCADTPRVIEAGNPGMASGGMGDALTGIIAALLAQGLSPFDAASSGALIHAMAGDAAAADGGERGLLASDLMPWLRRFANPVEDGEWGSRASEQGTGE
ncbi:MAG: NAD(P)H-hydrate dehydratase, partial [Xanthomonadales bacterium]|nr:NAD(P)H-hydrate dehydratase [Xanthomonadales bacterium]